MPLFKPALPRSKPPANDEYASVCGSSYGGDGKYPAPGGSPIGKLPKSGYSPVFSYKKQANTWASATKSPTSGGGKKVY